MAEVTGNLGDQPIELNNAATEATLKQLLAAMTVMVKNTGKDKAEKAKSQKDLEKELKRLTKASKEAADQQEDEVKDRKKRDKKKEEADARALEGAKATASALKGLQQSILGVASGMTNLMNSLAGVGNSMTAAAQSLNAIPVVGGTLATVLGAVAGAAEKSYKSFQQAASVGANFGGSITDMINAASGAGLTIDQFAGIVAKNGEAVALLGKGSGDGARQLAKLGKEIRNSGVADSLYRMGYSTEDINNGMAAFAGRLAKGGALQTMTTQQVAKVTGEYLQNLDAVSRLTGKSKQALQEEEAARMKDAQWLNLKSKLDAEGQKNLELLMATIPTEMQEGAKEVLATGTATSDAGRQFLAFMSKSGQSLQGLNQSIRQTGKLSLESAKSVADGMQAEGKALSKSPLGQNLSDFGDDVQKRFMVGANQYASQQANLSNTMAQQQKEAEERKKKEQELKDKGLDPASMEKYKQKLAETSNEFTKFLANSKLLDLMMSAFQKLAGFVETVVVPVFEFLSEHMTGFLIAVGAIAVPMMALNAAIWALETAKKIEAVRSFLASSVLGTFALNAGKASVSLFMMALPALKIVAILGAVAAVGYGLYKGFEWISDIVKSSGWTFSDTFEAIGDNLKRFYLSYVDIWLAIAEKIAGFFGKGDAVKAARAKIAQEKEELDEKEKARDQRRKEQGEKYKQDKALEEQKKKEEEASKKVTEAKEKETEAGKEKTEATESKQPGLDFSSPEKLYLSALKSKQAAFAQMPGAKPAAGQPGATAAQPGGVASPVGPQKAPAIKMEGLGRVAAQFESGGNAGTISSGHGDFGGKSYGAFQLSSKTGDVDKFLKSSGYAKQFEGMQVGSADFDKKWKELAQTKEFGAAQQAHAKKTHYDPQMEKLKKAGLDLSGKGAGVQEAIMSTANQYGANTDVIQKALAGKDTGKMSDKDIINSIQDFKASSIQTRFKSSSAAVQAGVAKRVEQERAALLGIQGGPQTGTPGAQPAAATPGAQPAAATPAAVPPKTVTPTPAQASSATTTDATAKAASEKAASEKAAAEKAAAEKAATEKQRPGTTVQPQPAQESAESLLAQLNMKMDRLIAVSSKSADLGSKQLSIARESSAAA